MAVDERWKKLGQVAELLNLEGVEFREYQFNIINAILKHGSSLVVLPTGLGKTFIGAAIIANALTLGKKALFMAPTRPLSEQHYDVLSKLLKLNAPEIVLLTGTTASKKRIEMEQNAKVLAATPQTIANDLKSGTFSLQGFGAAIFDECHRAVGKYAYTYVANELAVQKILVVGLTASPGSRREKIEDVVNALNIRHIEARTSVDADVLAYVMPKYIHMAFTDQTSTIEQMLLLLKPVGEDSLKRLNNMGLFNIKHFDRIPKGRLIELGNTIKKINAPGFRFGAFFCYVKLLNTAHAYDLLATEGIYPFTKYIESLQSREKKSRAVQSFLNDGNVKASLRLANEALARGEEHSKVLSAINILNRYKGKSAIVFAQYRSTIKMLVEMLGKNGITAVQFIGKREGVTQKDQKETIERFRSGEFKVLVASSIGEEGLDIPSVDLVVFYEPIPNEIRNIQRKGRTGRFRAGDVYILITRGTKDEIYMRVSATRERRMSLLIERINSELGKLPAIGTLEGQMKLE